MRGKRLARVLAVFLAVGVGGTATFAVDSPETLRKIEQKRLFDRRGVTQRWDYYRQHYLDYRNIPLLETSAASSVTVTQQSVVDDIRTGASLLSALDVDTVPSPGLRVGITSVDAQANYALGRQIVSLGQYSPISHFMTHFVWTMRDQIPASPDDPGQYVNYSSLDEGGILNQGFNGDPVSLGDFAHAGSPRIDSDSSGYPLVVLHQRIEEWYPHSTWQLTFPIPGASLHFNQEMASPQQFADETDMMWPDIAVGHESGHDEIIHVISMGARYLGNGGAEPSNRLWYWRYDRGASLPAWQGPALIDSSSGLSYSMDACEGNGTVLLAYTSDYLTDGFNGVNNVAYRYSYTSGAGWISGVELGPVNKNFVTSYSDPTGPRAWMETACAIDHWWSDSHPDPHIIFLEQRWPGSEHVAIRHWSHSRGTVRPVTLGYYDNDGFWLRTLNLGHISLGVGDGSVSCYEGTEDNEDYLYVMYTKLCGESKDERYDMSRLGYCNGELWLTSSNSGGDTWAPPVKLTATKTPGCTSGNPESVCASEAWGTIARDVHDYIKALYIVDYEAGSYQEAPWTMNHVMYALCCGGDQDQEIVCPLVGPSFTAYMSSEPECEYHAEPGGVNLETLTIANLGNDDLSGQVGVNIGETWLSVSAPGPYTIPPGGPDIVMDVVMDASSLSEDLYVGEIEITHNDWSKWSPHWLPFEFFVVRNFKCPQDAVLKTAVASPGVLSLEVASNARFALQNGEGGLWRYVDSSSTIFDASLILAYGNQGPDTIVYHRFYERPDPGQYGWRALSDLVIDTSRYSTGNGYAKARADMCTADSVIGVKVEWFFPQSPVYANFVVAKYTVWNRTASPISNVVVGLWADLDVIEAAHLDDLQRGVDNHPGFHGDKNLIYQYGYDTLWHTPVDNLNTAERYSGGVSYLAGRSENGEKFKLVPTWVCCGVGDNRDNTGPGHPNSGLFYRTLVNSTGYWLWEGYPHPDSAKDCYTWLRLDWDRTLDANGANPEVYMVAWVSDTLQHLAYPVTPGGLVEVTDSAWSWARQNAFCLCTCHTDPKCDGVTNVLDVVQTVNVAFRGAAPVYDDDCPRQRTDVNCDGVTSVIDVVKVVNVAFRSATPSSQFCNGCG